MAPPAGVSDWRWRWFAHSKLSPNTSLAPIQLFLLLKLLLDEMKLLLLFIKLVVVIWSMLNIVSVISYRVGKSICHAVVKSMPSWQVSTRRLVDSVVDPIRRLRIELLPVGSRPETRVISWGRFIFEIWRRHWDCCKSRFTAKCSDVELAVWVVDDLYASLCENFSPRQRGTPSKTSKTFIDSTKNDTNLHFSRLTSPHLHLQSCGEVVYLVYSLI